MLPDLTALRQAAEMVHAALPATPQYAWPLLTRRTGGEVWVKHENHLPTGAFKVRGGVCYMNRLKSAQPDCPGVIAATRGNHGQSIATAAGHFDLAAVVVVPEDNNPEKNRAMAAQGAELVIYGTDFQDALEHARELAEARGLHMVPSFDRTLVEGVGSYALELFETAPPLDAVFVPVGLGSGICGVIAARDALGLTTEVYGVQAEGAPCYALSFAQGRPISTNTVETYADGVATRVPVAEAVDIINRGAAAVVTVSDAQILQAQAIILRDTHNLAEPAGAAPLAGLIKMSDQMRGKRAAVILSGGNADAANIRQLANIKLDD